MLTTASNQPADRPDLSPATRLVTLGRQPHAPGGGVSAPLELSATFYADGTPSYGRAGNPTWSAFEEVLGSLEGGDALAFASGLAAADAALSLAPAGGTVVAPAAAYNGVVATLMQRKQAGELTVRFVDQTDMDAVQQALDGADLLWLESPTNPLLEVADLAALTSMGHTAGSLVVCDNTFATPLLQRPLEHGVDVVMHSVTKYLSGHSDVILGALVSRPDQAGGELGQRLLAHRTLRGAVPGPMEVWLAVRGLRTMHLRMERACANAAVLAERLGAHDGVVRVRYPGFGAIVSIHPRGGPAAAERVAAATRVWVHATSLGGVESLIERRRRHSAEPPTTPEDLLRLSVGVEDVEDLWRDLDQALRAIG